MSSKSFKIAKYRNPSGKESWRVSGTLHGKQIRKNFSDRKAAAAFKEQKEIERLNSARDVRHVATRLTPREVREAERAVDLVRETGKGILYAARFFRDRYIVADSEAQLSEAVDKYVHHKEKEADRGILTPHYVHRITVELRRFQKAFEGRTLAEISLEDLNGFLSKGQGGKEVALKTWNIRRGILSTLYKFSLKQGWISQNPILDLPHHGRRAVGRKKGEAETLSATDTEKLLEFLESFRGGRMVNFFAVTLFAGIRPDLKNGEISRIRPEHFDLDAGEITVPASVSKIGETRVVKIQDNLAAWLRRYPPDHFPIVPANARKLRLEVRKKFSLGHDVLRHTFCSFLYSKTKDLGDTAYQAGNSADMVRTHYTSYKKPAEVAKYWSLVPMQ